MAFFKLNFIEDNLHLIIYLLYDYVAILCDIRRVYCNVIQQCTDNGKKTRRQFYLR